VEICATATRIGVKYKASAKDDAAKAGMELLELVFRIDSSNNMYRLVAIRRPELGLFELNGLEQLNSKQNQPKNRDYIHHLDIMRKFADPAQGGLTIHDIKYIPMKPMVDGDSKGDGSISYSRMLRDFTGSKVHSSKDETFYFSGKFAEDRDEITYLHATSNKNGTGKNAEFAYDIYGCLVAERLDAYNFESFIFRYP
jgi:hypothetical protein